MSMKIKLTTRPQGSSERVKALIICIGKGNDEQSDYIVINNLVKVRFRFIQNQQREWYLHTQIEVQKIAPDCVVKAKVSSTEFNYSSKKIYSEKTCWDVMGDRMFSLENKNSKVFQFSVTISAYKVEAMINEKLYSDDEFTDFRLSTTKGHGHVSVHKAYLAAHSDVFKMRLSREWKEINEVRIHMKGVSLQTLQHLKDYMYKGTLPDDGLLPLLSIASCYLIENLKSECLSKLTLNIKPAEFYNLLEYSIENKMPELTFAIIKATPETVVGVAEKMCQESPTTRNEETLENYTRYVTTINLN